MSPGATRYAGTVTTSGNSQAIRLEKSLFRAHPEFGRNGRVTATVIAPGRMIVSIVDDPVSENDDDPVVEAFVSFLAADIESHPERLEPLSAGSIGRAAELTEGIEAGDDEVFPDDASV